MLEDVSMPKLEENSMILSEEAVVEITSAEHVVTTHCGFGLAMGRNV